MAKKAKKKAKKTSSKFVGQPFSVRALHRELDATLKRLNKKKKTPMRDKLIALVKAARLQTKCPQQMLFDLGRIATSYS